MRTRFLTQEIKISGESIVGPLPTGPAGINNLGDLINRILPFLTAFAGVILLFVFIWGGYDFITSQGDAQKVKSAQAKITTGIIGFVLLIISYLLVRVIAKIFGLEGGIL